MKNAELTQLVPIFRESAIDEHRGLQRIIPLKRSYGFFWISNGLRLFWKIATVLRLAARALSKQYCLSPASTGRFVLHGLAERQEPQNNLPALIFLCYFLFIKEKKVRWISASKRNEQMNFWSEGNLWSAINIFC